MSKVYFTDLRTEPKRGLLDKLRNGIERLRIHKVFRTGELVAIKIHFGELGNTAFVRPLLVRPFVDKLLSIGAKPFLTDTNTLYKGSRSDAISHLFTAIYNGFDYSSTGCPLVIADGIRGKDSVKLRIDGEVLSEVSIARGILDADGLIVITHFKGHELTGFGGALKNLGMGCASREGKLIQHSSVSPTIDEKLCKGCGICPKYCPQNAIELKENKARIKDDMCIGCGECVIVCERKAIKVDYNEPPDVFQKKMVEHAYAVWREKRGKIFFVNFVTQVSPACDCYPSSDSPIVRDIGVLFSEDPVAIDTASSDLVMNEESLPGSRLRRKLPSGEDKWRALYPEVDWRIQLEYAERLGMGTRTYTLVKI